MSSGSVDQTNDYVFEVIPHAAEEGASKALCYWSTGNGDDTMVTLWNPADEEQDLSFTLFYTGGQYVYPIQLGPRETRSFNVSEILHSSIPDAEGNVIPAGISEGSAEVAGSLGEHQHILIGLDTAVYNVRKATCGNYCWYCNGVVYASIAASPFAVAVGGTTGETFYETRDSGYQYSTSASWTSSSHSIATVNGSGAVTGVSAGSVSIGAMDLSPEAIAGNACTDWTNFCPTQYFSAPPTPGNTLTGTISLSPDPIPLSGTGVATVKVTPDQPAELAIAQSGTGNAVFVATLNGTYLIQGPYPQSVSIKPVAQSNGNADLNLTVSYGSTLLAQVPFSVTSGVCSITSQTGHGGAAIAPCPSTVQNYDTYTIVQYCGSCSFTCKPVSYDSSFTPSSCSVVNTGVLGAGTSVLKSTVTGTFAAHDCNVHNLQIQTTTVNAQGTPTTYTGGGFGLKCQFNSSGNQCP